MPEDRDFLDAHGVGFWHVRQQGLLPERVSEWPRIKRVKRPEVLENMHSWHGLFSDCWLCDQRPREPLEAHHITGGTKGRSDEYTNLVMLCRKCHARVQSSTALLPQVLYVKWLHDAAHTNWQRLCLLHGRWLPDLYFPGITIEIPR